MSTIVELDGRSITPETALADIAGATALAAPNGRGVILFAAGCAWLARRYAEARDGQALVEYALLLAFIGLLLIGAFQFLQPAISNTLDNIANSLQIGG